MKQDYELLNRLLNCLHDQVALIGKDLKILYHNQAFESFLLLNLRDFPDIDTESIEELFQPNLTLITEAILECFRDGQITNRTIELDYLNRKTFYKVVVIPQHNGSEISECILILYSNTVNVLKSIELNQRLQFLSKLIHRLPLGVYMFDRMGDETAISLWNPQMAKYFNLKEEDVMGKDISSVFHPEIAAHHLKAIEQMHQGEISFEYPAEYIETSEGMKYMKLTLTPIQDTDGPDPVYSYLGIMEDVSEKIARDSELKKYQTKLKEALKNTSEKLSLSNAEISSILENSYGISIFSLDRDLRYRVFNLHHFMVMSRSGKNIAKGGPFPGAFLKLSDKGMTLEDLFNQALSGKSITKEIHFLHPDKTDLYMDAVVSPLYSHEEIIGITAVFFDTTEQRQAEKEAEIFKSVAENADYGVFLTDMNLDIHYVNHYFNTLFNNSEKQLVGTNLNSILTEKQISRIKNKIKLAKGNNAKNQLELDLKSKNKTITTVLVNFLQYHEINNNPGGMAFTCLDITPMKKAQETLIRARDNAERSSILKSSFVANMSHEIRTPLNAILGFAELMNGQLLDPQMSSHLQNIRSSGHILKGLINDILDFSKIEAGKMQYNPIQDNIIQFFQELFNLFGLQAKEKKLHFEICSIGEVPETLIYDPVRLRQILINLIGNSMKFTPWGYIRLILKYESSKQTLLLSVEDTGIGIPPSDQEYIFNPFEQQEKQDSRTFEGTGLGLAITKKLIELMDGKIQLKSEIYQGSQFRLALTLPKGDSGRSKGIRYQEKLFQKDESFTCIVEDSLLTEKMKIYGRNNNIDFSLLSEMGQSSKTRENAKEIILLKESHPPHSNKRQVLIRLVEPQKIKEEEKEKGYFLSSQLDTERMLYMIHSILKQETGEKDAGDLDFKVLNLQELNIIQKAIDTKNFQDIDEALPYIKKCENQEHMYSKALKNAVSSFDIPKLNKIMEQVQENYNHKDM